MRTMESAAPQPWPTTATTARRLARLLALLEARR